jgi:hypothetical protein
MLVARFFRVRRCAHQLQRVVVTILGERNPFRSQAAESTRGGQFDALSESVVSSAVIRQRGW